MSGARSKRFLVGPPKKGLKAKKLMSPVGFEPTPLARLEP
jgi:hypothetical protein